MITLDTTTRKIKVALNGAPATQFPCVASYTDITSTGATPGATTTTTNGITYADIVAAPAASTQRIVKSLTIWNTTSSGSYLVSVVYDDNGTNRSLWSGYLEFGATLQYAFGDGFTVIDRFGRIKTTHARDYDAPRVVVPVALELPDILSNFSCVTTQSWFGYLGRATGEHNSVTLRYRVTTAAVTITWAEVAIFRGAPDLGAGCYLDRLGYTDVSAVVNSTGQKSTTVNLTSCQPGDHLWWAAGNQATTVMVLRASINDSAATGVNSGLAQNAQVRPSLVTQVNTAMYTASTTFPWVVAQFNG